MAGLFGDRYANLRLDTRDAHTAREASLVLGALGPSPRVLDVGCGRGRVALELAARGARVTACDVNPGYLATVDERAAARGVDVETRLLDDRALDYEARFDGVLSLFASFGYHDDAGNAAVLRGMAQALAPGGRLFLDVQNRDFDLGPRERVLRHPADPLRTAVVTSTFDAWTSVRGTTYRFREDGREVERGQLRIRMYALHELVALVRECGLDVDGVYGSTACEPFDPRGKGTFVVAARPDA